MEKNKTAGCPVAHASHAESGVSDSVLPQLDFYRGVVDAALDAIIVISASGIVEYFNRASERLFGYSARDILGKNVSMLMPPPERDRHDSYLERYVSTGRQRIVGTEREVLAQRRDGSLFPIELAVTEVLVEGRRVFAGTIRDVSVRRKMEASLRLLDSIVSSTDAAIVVRDLTGKIIQWNQGAELLYGYTAKEAVGLHSDLIVPSSRMRELADATSRVIAGEPNEQLETVRVRKDGKEINVALNVSPVYDVKGSVAAVMVSSRDITPLKEVEKDLQRAEQYAERLIETANAMVIMLGADGRILLFNQAAERVTGYASKEVVGRKWYDVFVPSEERSESKERLAALLAGGLREYESTLRTKDGQDRVISWRNSLLTDWSASRVLSFGIDITDERTKEQLLQRAHDDLELRVTERTAELSLANQILEREIADRQTAERKIAATLREKEVFLKEIHHRVKNNLQLVISILNLHIDEMSNNESEDALSEIRDRIYAIAHLHETLYQSGDLVHVNIDEYLRGVISNLVHSSSEAAQIDVVFDIDPVALNLDETLRCGLIVNELVLNSLKHAFFGRSSGRIWISVKREGGGGFLRITVTDDGIGLPDEARMQDSRSIGFHLVEKLTEKLEGKVQYMNTPGAKIEVSFMPEDEQT